MSVKDQSIVVSAAILAGACIGSSLTFWLANRRGRKPERAPGIKAWRMSKWIKHNGILRTQGLCGDFSNMPSSTAQQTTEALDKLDGILKDVGIPRSNLLAITIFIADMSTFDEMNSVYDQWVDPIGLPTRLCVQATMGHGAAVEFRAEAYY